MTQRLITRQGALFLLGIFFSVSKPSAAISDPPRALQQASDAHLGAGELVNKGVAAYKNGQSEEAIEYFRQAKQLDPGLIKACLYLATAYASQYTPGAPSPENLARGNQAVAEFKEVLDRDPKNLSAIDGLGYILYQMAQPFDANKFEESKKYHQRHIELKPDDPEPYYWLGVIDWALAFRRNRELRGIYNETAREQLAAHEALPPSLTADFVRDNGAMVDEGIGYLKKAIELRPDYEDAMLYLNLLYRQKADMEWNRENRDRDLKRADDLVDQVKEIKEKKIRTLPPQSE